MASGLVMNIASRSRRLRSGWYAQAVGLVRPGAEALLLAGVALGCAQLGWRLIAPENVEPVVNSDTAEPSARNIVETMRSPFAPFASDDTNTSHADISGIRLVGVRMSEREEQSGAVFTLGDGTQRSFLIGYEVASGVRLEGVAADHVVLAFAGGEQALALDRPQRAEPSLALALIGRSGPGVLVEDKTATVLASDTSAQAVSLPASAGKEAANWLFATMGQVEVRNGAPYGWRAAASPPAQLVQAGIGPGDLIVSVNGAGPGAGQAALASAANGPLDVVVERRSGQRIKLTLVGGISQ